MTLASQPAGDNFYDRALERMERSMVVLGIAGLATASVAFGWRIACGFALGGGISYLNFYWLKKIVAGIAELTVARDSPVSARGVVHRFVLRYFLMAVVAFVILRVSRESLYGLFAGLFLPVGAVFCEAAYEVYKVVTRDDA